jgi:hypothetical protein
MNIFSYLITLKKSVSIFSTSRVPSVGKPARGDIVPGTGMLEQGV